MPKAKAAPQSDLLALQVDKLTRAVRALKALRTGRLVACAVCSSLAERKAVIENPVSGTKYQDLCGSCFPNSPYLARANNVTYVALTQAAEARAVNADLGALEDT